MITVWKLAMLAILLPTLIAPTERGQRLRVWCVMIGASLLASFHSSLWYYIALDVVAAWVIMMHPKTVWQRAIGLFYVGMVLLSLGFLLHGALHNFSSGGPNTDALKQAHDYLAWLAVATLCMWGGDGIARDYWLRRDADSDLPANEPGRVR